MAPELSPDTMTTCFRFGNESSNGPDQFLLKLILTSKDMDLINEQGPRSRRSHDCARLLGYSEPSD